MKISQITEVIERFAPLGWQESYDNAGFLVGRPDDEVHKALLAVDVTEEVLDEAEAEGCDIVLTHHPIVFHALKRFNSADPVQRCVERAIRSRIALYACHTNLDSAPGGMSWRLAGMLGVGNLEVLQPAEAGGGVGFGVVGDLPEDVDTVEFMRFSPAEARSEGDQTQRRGDSRGAPRGGLHRCRCLADRRRTPRRSRNLHHRGLEVQRLHDTR